LRSPILKISFFPRGWPHPAALTTRRFLSPPPTIDFLEQHRHPSIHEHVWIRGGFLGIDLGQRQHGMQESAHPDLGIEDHQAQTAAQSMRDQNITLLAKFHIGNNSNMSH
jgi:hypothetical protein